MTIKDTYPLLVFGALLACAASTILWNVVMNTSKKKQVLASRRWYDCIGIRKTNDLVYRYDAEGITCYKEYRKELPACYTESTPFPQAFSVRLLPDYPQSGIPEAQVFEREAKYSSTACVEHAILPLILLVFGITCIVASTVSSESKGVEVFEIVMITILLSIPSGAPFAECLFLRWKKNILSSGKWEVSSEENSLEGSVEVIEKAKENICVGSSNDLDSTETDDEDPEVPSTDFVKELT